MVKANDPADLISGVRALKNKIIGNKSQKRKSIAEVPLLCSLLASDDLALRREAAAAVGSFASGYPAGRTAVRTHEAERALWRSLELPDKALRRTAALALCR
jgi:hypothetical protein